jgi:hypothetical protein
MRAIDEKARPIGVAVATIEPAGTVDDLVLLEEYPEYRSACDRAAYLAERSGTVVHVRTSGPAWGVFVTRFVRAVVTTKDMTWLREESSIDKAVEYEQAESQRLMQEELSENLDRYNRSDKQGWFYSDKGNG